MWLNYTENFPVGTITGGPAGYMWKGFAMPLNTCEDMSSTLGNPDMIMWPTYQKFYNKYRPYKFRVAAKIRQIGVVGQISSGTGPGIPVIRDFIIYSVLGASSDPVATFFNLGGSSLGYRHFVTFAGNIPTLRYWRRSWKPFAAGGHWSFKRKFSVADWNGWRGIPGDSYSAATTSNPAITLNHYYGIISLGNEGDQSMYFSHEHSVSTKVLLYERPAISQGDF